MLLEEGVKRPGHDPLRSTLEVLGWLVGARFAPVGWLEAEAERRWLKAVLRQAEIRCLAG